MRAIITGDTLGVVYIVCLDQPIGNLENTRAQASHYLGWTVDLYRRTWIHASGRGAPIVKAAVDRGIGFMIFGFHGTPNDERYLKNHYKNTPHLCPRCAVQRGGRSRMPLQPLAQLHLPLHAELPTVDPAVFARPMDRYEYLRLQGVRQALANLQPVKVLAPDWDDGLL